MPKQERDELTAAYLFLRDVEHKLQMVHDLQTHALPDSPDELARCAIRLGYPSRDRKAAMAAFLKDHQIHTGLVNRLFKEFVEHPEGTSLFQSAIKRVGARRSPPDNI
jgi:glutamate-ammonia-ligase adenylyltransferase